MLSKFKLKVKVRIASQKVSDYINVEMKRMLNYVLQESNL